MPWREPWSPLLIDDCIIESVTEKKVYESPFYTVNIKLFIACDICIRILTFTPIYTCSRQEKERSDNIRETEMALLRQQNNLGPIKGVTRRTPLQLSTTFLWSVEASAVTVSPSTPCFSKDDLLLWFFPATQGYSSMFAVFLAVLPSRFLLLIALPPNRSSRVSHHLGALPYYQPHRNSKSHG